MAGKQEYRAAVPVLYRARGDFFRGRQGDPVAFKDANDIVPDRIRGIEVTCGKIRRSCKDNT